MTEAARYQPWHLSSLKKVKRNGLMVFSCFHCGGGSSMGYKLAGYEVLGGVEIDPKIMALYRRNFKPKHSYQMGVEAFNKLPNDELPPELFDLDILDGSPPCSSFSIAGAREKKWGKKAHFREGQKKQVLDDLFFHFIDTAAKLNPKVVVAENVKGLIIGRARGYVKTIFQQFHEAGYDTQLFLLNAASMGVPQSRERTFFIARRRDLDWPPIQLNFSESPISVAEAFRNLPTAKEPAERLTEYKKSYWLKAKLGQSFNKVHPKGHLFNECKLDPNKPSRTLVANYLPSHWLEPRRLTSTECIRLQSFPDDYDFGGLKAGYVCGMSVPPFMMQRVAAASRDQWFNNE